VWVREKRAGKGGGGVGLVVNKVQKKGPGMNRSIDLAGEGTLKQKKVRRRELEGEE